VSGKYKVWGKLLNERDIVVMLVDSFTTRDVDGDVGGGVCYTGDPLYRPGKIDPISVRPADIAAGISYVKSRSDFQTDRVGVLGFSNGGTSALVLANHEDLMKRSDVLNKSGKTWFDLPFNQEYQADLFVALYPGCGLNGYSNQTQDIFNDEFLTYTDTFLYIASDDRSLPANTKEKCQSLRLLDAGKSYDYPNMTMKVVENTDHQFDYKGEPVIEYGYRYIIACRNAS
jgi:dienelactone hydrolase